MRTLALLLGFVLAACVGPSDSKPTYHIYLAGPEVFLPRADAIRVGVERRAQVADFDPEGRYSFRLEAEFPLDKEVEPFRHDPETARRIFEGNVAMMERSQVVLANMVAFRGPSMDSGTAFEMGYMLGSDRLVFGYYDASDFPPTLDAPANELSYLERVRRIYGLSDDSTEAPPGIEIENFRLMDNLMMVSATGLTGCPIAPSFEAAIEYVAEYLAARDTGAPLKHCRAPGSR